MAVAVTTEVMSLINSMISPEYEPEAWEQEKNCANHTVCAGNNQSSLPSLVALASQTLAYKVGQAIHTYYLPIVFLVGFLGNVLTLIVMLQAHNRRISCCLYMAALAVADSGNLATAVNFWKMTEFTTGDLNNTECIFVVYCSSACYLYGVALIISMTVDRFLAVRFPLKSPRWCTTRRAKITIVTSALAVFTYNIPYIIYSKVVNGKVCASMAVQTAFSQYYTLFNLFLNSAVPFVTLLTLNTFIIITIRGRRKFLGKENNLAKETTSGNSKAAKDASRDRALTVMLVSVSFILLVLSMPLFIRLLAYLFINKNKNVDTYATYVLVHNITNKMYYTNCAVNFFLYAIAGKKFREDLVTILCCGTQKKSHSQQLSAAVSTSTVVSN